MTVTLELLHCTVDLPPEMLKQALFRRDKFKTIFVEKVLPALRDMPVPRVCFRARMFYYGAEWGTFAQELAVIAGAEHCHKVHEDWSHDGIGGDSADYIPLKAYLMILKDQRTASSSA